jgi:hypothetical protein
MPASMPSMTPPQCHTEQPLYDVISASATVPCSEPVHELLHHLLAMVRCRPRRALLPLHHQVEDQKLTVRHLVRERDLATISSSRHGQGCPSEHLDAV